MLRFVFIGFLLSVYLSSDIAAQEQPKQKPTTFVVVRHADRDGSKDALTSTGKERAKRLSELARMLRVSAVYSTDYQRTKKTAEPTVQSLKLKLNTYAQLNQKWFNDLKSKHRGKVVLIVGHSNTVGKIATGLGGKVDQKIGHHDFDDLFIVMVSEKTVRAVRLKYGK